jgi:hypothetical protein
MDSAQGSSSICPCCQGTGESLEPNKVNMSRSKVQRRYGNRMGQNPRPPEAGHTLQKSMINERNIWQIHANITDVGIWLMQSSTHCHRPVGKSLAVWNFCMFVAVSGMACLWNSYVFVKLCREKYVSIFWVHSQLFGKGTNWHDCHGPRFGCLNLFEHVWTLCRVSQ